MIIAGSTPCYFGRNRGWAGTAILPNLFTALSLLSDLGKSCRFVFLFAALLEFLGGFGTGHLVTIDRLS